MRGRAQLRDGISYQPLAEMGDRMTSGSSRVGPGALGDLWLVRGGRAGYRRRMDPLIRDGFATYRMGEGPTVLVMPGPHRYERPGLRCADAFHDHPVALGYQVVTFDPPGSGLSTRAAELSMEEMHACADEALDAVGVAGPVDALGHSMAGLVLLAYALARPERIARLVLVGTGTGGRAYMRARGALWNRSHPGFWGLAPLGILNMVLPTRAPERLMNNYIERRSFHDENLAEYDPVHLQDWGRAREGRPDWHWKVARYLDYRDRLDEIEVPCLVACGRDDPQFPPDCARELAEGLPNSRLICFAHSGHYPHIEEPAAFSEALASFLDGTPA